MNTKSKFRPELLTIFLALVLPACTFSGFKSDGANPVDLETENPNLSLHGDQISFQLVVESVMEAKCLNCHSPEGGNRGGYNFRGYENTISEIQMIKDAIIGDSMPKRPLPPLTPTEKDLILKWIDAGAKEFAQNAVELSQERRN